MEFVCSEFRELKYQSIFFSNDNDYDFQSTQPPTLPADTRQTNEKFASYAKPWIYIHVMISLAVSMDCEMRRNKNKQTYWGWGLLDRFFLSIYFLLSITEIFTWIIVVIENVNQFQLKLFLDFEIKRPKSVIHFKYLNRFSVVLKWLLSRTLFALSLSRSILSHSFAL